jgi:hypothetical protein
MFFSLNLKWAILESSSTAAEYQVENYQQQDQTETTAAVVADTGAHIESATAEQQEQDY